MLRIGKEGSGSQGPLTAAGSGLSVQQLTVMEGQGKYAIAKGTPYAIIDTVSKALDPSSWSPSNTTLGSTMHLVIVLVNSFHASTSSMVTLAADSADSLSHKTHLDSVRTTEQVRPEAPDTVSCTVVPIAALTPENVSGRA